MKQFKQFEQFDELKVFNLKQVEENEEKEKIETEKIWSFKFRNWALRTSEILNQVADIRRYCTRSTSSLSKFQFNKLSKEA